MVICLFSPNFESRKILRFCAKGNGKAVIVKVCFMLWSTVWGLSYFIIARYYLFHKIEIEYVLKIEKALAVKKNCSNTQGCNEAISK
jgi:TM2 domain-containing membrane protein YozV